MKSLNVLITGGAGFIGSHISDSLIEEGYSVAVVDNLSSGRAENVNKKARFYEEDIRNAEKVNHIFQKENPDFVFHAAAQINLRESIRNPVEDAGINIIGSLNILEACKNKKIKKIIFSSSGGAIYSPNCHIPANEDSGQEPLSPYGITKLAVEKYLSFYRDICGLDYVSLRYSNVYGPGQNNKGDAGVVSVFVNNILEGKPVTINGSGSQTRDYIYIEDVVRANLLAMKELHGVFNVSTGIETSVNTLFYKIKKIMNTDVKEIHVDGIRGELERSCLSSEKIKNYGWSPYYNVDSGLKETINFFISKK